MTYTGSDPVGKLQSMGEDRTEFLQKSRLPAGQSNSTHRPLAKCHAPPFRLLLHAGNSFVVHELPAHVAQRLNDQTAQSVFRPESVWSPSLTDSGRNTDCPVIAFSVSSASLWFIPRGDIQRGGSTTEAQRARRWEIGDGRSGIDCRSRLSR